VSSRDITEELVQQVIADLHARYALDDDDVRALGPSSPSRRATKGAPTTSRSPSASSPTTGRRSTGSASSTRPVPDQRWTPTLDDYLELAAFLLGTSPDRLQGLPRIGLAESAIHARRGQSVLSGISGTAARSSCVYGCSG
jgi:hypothetical protein